MTLQTVRAALAGAKVVDLAHPYRVGMPQSPNHPPFRLALERRHGDVVRADGGSAANEIIVLGGHVGTHVDALAHVSQDGTVHGGELATSLQSHQGFRRLGIEEFQPYVGAAVLLDVAAVRGVASLDPGTEVTVADLEQAREHAAVPIEPGEVILIGTGWSRHWDDVALFTGQRDGAPGPGEAAARWLAGHRPRAVGAETIAFEHIAAGAGHARLPVHRILLVESGINIVETMNLAPLLDLGVSELGLVLNPLNILGATGGPVRPLAVLA
jgi:kynurenine formamidase